MTIPGSKKHFCEKLVVVGLWEGVDSCDQITSGPVVQCVECGRKFSLTTEKWERINFENRLGKFRRKRHAIL